MLCLSICLFYCLLFVLVVVFLSCNRRGGCVKRGVGFDKASRETLEGNNR